MRGLRASNWSLFRGDLSSGYTFHRMDTGLDTGNVLVDGDVPVFEADSAANLEARKARAAVRKLPELRELIKSRDQGRPQQEVGCIHNRTAWQLLTSVEFPEVLSLDEWYARLRACLVVNTLIDGQWWPVTGVRLSGRPRGLSFVTADGFGIEVVGLRFWPATWYRRYVEVVGL